MSLKLTVTISQSIHISNHCFVHLEQILLYINYVSIKLEQLNQSKRRQDSRNKKNAEDSDFEHGFGPIAVIKQLNDLEKAT